MCNTGQIFCANRGPVSAPLCKEEQDEYCQSPTAVNLSDQTIRDRPHEGGLRARRPVVGPVLTGQHRRARLAFATEHQNWQIHHRRLVLFTDESRFYLSTCDRRDRLWRRRGECYAACNIIQHDWFGGGSVMVWGGISLEGHTDLYRLDHGTLTAIRYQDEILGPVVRPYAGAVGPGFLLVHNNARPHVARVCRQFLENEEIDTIDWPTRRSSEELTFSAVSPEELWGSYWRWVPYTKEMGIERLGIERPNIERPMIKRLGIKRPGIERPGIERLGIERLGIERLWIERPVIERLWIERPWIERLGIERPRIEKLGIKRPDIERPMIKRLGIKRPGIERVGIERPVIERPVIERPWIERLWIERPWIERLGIERPGIEGIPIQESLASQLSWVQHGH
ncbi:hypothetical protein NFI96_004052 [Prochilodus magdalenae]|nr:hypothetical protein NFI96_004052 [Prochilodus magdalenae]